MGSMRIYFSSFIKRLYIVEQNLLYLDFSLPLEHIHTPIAILGLNKTACEKINKVLVKKNIKSIIHRSFVSKFYLHYRVQL